jgi:vacuolar protein sorting-associated protein 72
MASGDGERTGRVAAAQTDAADGGHEENDVAVSDTSSDSGLDSSSEEQVEWLATGRAKRSTAGNRMASMLANEERATGAADGADDSDLELLFAEGDDDVEFADENQDDGSDAHMDSSSSDEDDNEAADNLAGEKELERQAREKRTAARKRKAQEAIPMKFRKKTRTKGPHEDGTSDHGSKDGAGTPTMIAPPAPAPRPKKKSERLSWLPTAAEKPTRASERATTKISKEQLHQQMVEREARRKKQLEIQERKAKKLALLKKPPLTQAERLAEAAIVEKRNSKSLNRWEEAEKQREEERLAKLAALNNRKLSGPVVTFWSGIQAVEEGASGEAKHAGLMVSMEEKPRKKREANNAATLAFTATDQNLGNGKVTAISSLSTPQAPSLPSEADEKDIIMESAGEPANVTQPAESSKEMLSPSTRASESHVLMPSLPLAHPLIDQNISAATAGSDRDADATRLVPSAGLNQDDDTENVDVEMSKDALAISMAPPQLPLAIQRAQAEVPDPSKSKSPASPAFEEKFTRSCIVLQNFDEDAIKDKHVQTQILFGRKMNKKSGISAHHHSSLPRDLRVFVERAYTDP